MKVLGFGEVLWDKIENKLSIGGTVFNFIAHCKKLGAETYFISAVGNDDLGKKTLSIIRSKGIHDDLIKTVDASTCIVKVSVDKSGAPSYYLDDFTSWDSITIKDSDLHLINEMEFDYFCFGTLAQRSTINVKSLKTIFDNCNFKNIFYDINIRLHHYNKSKIEYSMQKCDILKMNRDELKEVKRLFGFKEKDYKVLTNKIHKEFNISIVCITEGESGAYISSRNNFIFCPGYKVNVNDTVGAGDAFSAALITRLYEGYSIKGACDFACRMGAVVASLRGAIPDYNLDDIYKICKVPR